MMGHRAKLVGGDEYDALTRARRLYRFRPGEIKRIKRKFHKRMRRIWRLGQRNEVRDIKGLV